MTDFIRRHKTEEVQEMSLYFPPEGLRKSF
jgi:hypothetical protein